MSAVRVAVDPDLCVGTAECVRIAPEAFTLDETRGVSAARAGAGDTDRVRLGAAVDACPMRAISVREANGAWR